MVRQPRTARACGLRHVIGHASMTPRSAEIHCVPARGSQEFFSREQGGAPLGPRGAVRRCGPGYGCPRAPPTCRAVCAPREPGAALVRDDACLLVRIVCAPRAAGTRVFRGHFGFHTGGPTSKRRLFSVEKTHVCNGVWFRFWAICTKFCFRRLVPTYSNLRSVFGVPQFSLLQSLLRAAAEEASCRNRGDRRKCLVYVHSSFYCNQWLVGLWYYCLLMMPFV